MRQIIFIILLICPAIAFCTESNKTSASPKILVVAASHNISSGYYPISMLAQDMKTDEGSLEKELNNKLIATITTNSQLFVPILDCPADNPKDLLSENNADYVVVINDYNFDQRVKPMNTVFHIISYSLHNRHGECILKDSDHYSTLELMEIDKLSAQMQKCSKKISKNILAKITSK